MKITIHDALFTVPFENIGRQILYYSPIAYSEVSDYTSIYRKKKKNRNLGKFTFSRVIRIVCNTFMQKLCKNKGSRILSRQDR